MSTISLQHYSTQHYQNQPRTFCRPPSPPMEPVKCTLPSISNLIGLADAGSPTHESSPIYSPRSDGPSSRRHSLLKSESRPGSAYGKPFPRGFPPSPPMSTDASLDNRSPSTKSVSQFSSNPSTPRPRYHESTPPLDPTRPRQLPPLTLPAPTGDSPASGYYTPTSAPPPTSGMAYQRPLPSVQSFPHMMVPVTVAPASGPISWQHHHYLQPVPGHLYTQTQDRYICQTCNKAFSRPSSLRIHSHSHTGEKPFKCSQAGCGKAFSVRSNMKRHERGCHATSVEVAAGRAVRIH